MKKNYLTSKEYWKELKNIRSLCQECIEEYNFGYYSEDGKALIGDIFALINQLKDDLIEVFKLEDSRRLNRTKHEKLEDNLEEIYEISYKLNEGIFTVNNSINNLLNKLNEIIEEHQENTSRKYDRKYKDKRTTKRTIKRKNIKSDAQIKREKRYGQYFLMRYTGATLEEIAEWAGISKQAVYNFLKRNKDLEKVVTKEKTSD
ncbi:Uncharacterised protein [Clostridium perfringens]|uniref:hypothetical protein n=1 Tax=Clostridium perfringens TaxID=1502 RepID=UPI000E17233E|nr:hypothetical protein [Clostridium perfringens]MDK0954081.1 hypothetical protein [Clostridium perfringens]SUY53424.1 Uncharacterised protein [Clostridium perfringens]